MQLALNKNQPLIMHIDLNSCFASIEQQANRLIRGRPVGVAAYDTPGGIILAASYEAKALGIKLGTTVREARVLSPGIYITTPDPEKYREAHRKFKNVLLRYSPIVVPKSIDEFVIDFSGSPYQDNNLEDIGYEIKQRIYEGVGEAVRCNVGIGTNRFWAKTAAGLHKPDGLDVMSADNAKAIYESLRLTDLCGISYRYEARLKAAGVNTPSDMLAADRHYLERRVFKGVVGYYWYLRLRGYEIDSVDFGRKSYGHQYAIGHKTRDRQELESLLMKLSEKTGRRLRRGNSVARSIYLYIRFENFSSFKIHKRLAFPLYSSLAIFRVAKSLMEECELSVRATLMSVAVGALEPADPEQLGLFEALSLGREKKISKALDEINDRYGEFVVTPANMSNMGGLILDRIAFGNVKEL